MGNIGSQNGHKQTTAEDIQWPHSFPRTQPRYQQNQLKVLPDRNPKIRLRHTQNGELLLNKGTLSGRQTQNRLDEGREIQKCESEPHLNRLVNHHRDNSFESDREKRFKKKYRAPPPPPVQSSKYDGNQEYWDTRNDTPPKPRLFKTKTESERKKSDSSYQEKSDYIKSQNRNVYNTRGREESEDVSLSSIHRLSLPALNAPAWDFQGELKEVTKKLRKIKADNNDQLHNDLLISENSSKRDKLKTLDHHIGKMDLIKLKNSNLRQMKLLKKQEDSIDYDNTGENITTDESPHKKGTKTEAPKQFYFGMASPHDENHAEFDMKNSADSESSGHLKNYMTNSDEDIRNMMPKKVHETNRLSSDWKHSSSVDSVFNETTPKNKYSSEENDEAPRVFSIFPVRSASNDRSRSGDSGISGDGCRATYEEGSAPLRSSKDNLQSLPLLPGWTPQQDLGDDSSSEEDSFTAGDYPENYDLQSNQKHVLSLSLPRDHHLASYVTENFNETNFEKLKRSVSGILNTMNKKEAESTPENEKGNWFLNKSCSDLISPHAQANYSKLSEELDEFLTRSTKLNTGRIIYLPKTDKPSRPRRYETRNKPKYGRDDQLERPAFSSIPNLSQTKSKNVPESLQDSPIMSDRKSYRKKPKRFTFQSTIRQIERRRIAEKLSREAEKKEQQRLREFEIMQKVEQEFQRKRDREKNDIKQQLSRYSNENALYNSSPDLKNDTDSPVGELQRRSEPDGATSSPTSSLSQLDNKPDQKKFREKCHTDFVNNNWEYNSDDNRSKPIMQTQILSEYRQTQREYRDYQSSKKHFPDGSDRQTTVHPKVIYKMPTTKGITKYESNNYRKDFAYGMKTKLALSLQGPAQTQHQPNEYYSQFGPLTRL